MCTRPVCTSRNLARPSSPQPSAHGPTGEGERTLKNPAGASPWRTPSPVKFSTGGGQPSGSARGDSMAHDVGGIEPGSAMSARGEVLRLVPVGPGGAAVTVDYSVRDSETLDRCRMGHGGERLADLGQGGRSVSMGRVMVALALGVAVPVAVGVMGDVLTQCRGS
jgi:hypothetical protein